MAVESDRQLVEQRSRWNERAATWDEEIKKPDHYANFENGYQKFLDFGRKQFREQHFRNAIDLGCGTGESFVYWYNVDNLYFLDIAEEMLKEARKKYPDGNFIQASVHKIPLADKTMDLVLSRGILVSHLPAGLVPDFFSEISRITKPGSQILIDFMCNQETADFKLTSPKNTFTLEKMEQILGTHGFYYIEFDGNNNNRVVRVSATKTNN